jgi:hypothetical protein
MSLQMGACTYFIFLSLMMVLIAYLCYSYALYTKQFHTGTRSLAGAGMTITVLMHELQMKKKFSRSS